MTERPKRSGIMLCYPFEQARLEGSSKKAWNTWPVLVQPKLDGERCRALFNEDGQVLLLSSTEEPIVSVPHLIDQLEATGLRSIELDGELYCHGMHFEDIHSRVSRSVNLHPEFYQIEYHVFDIIEPRPCVARLLELATISSSLEKLPNLKIVTTELCQSFDEIMTSFQSFCDNGYEGIIVRKPDAPYLRQRSTGIMKFKPKKSDIYRIIGFEEEQDKHGNPKGTLGALVCCGDDGTPFSVGTGFNAEQRRNLWELREMLPGNLIRVMYQAMTPGKKVPRFPVFGEIITTK